MSFVIRYVAYILTVLISYEFVSGSRVCCRKGGRHNISSLLLMCVHLTSKRWVGCLCVSQYGIREFVKKHFGIDDYPNLLWSLPFFLTLRFHLIENGVGRSSGELYTTKKEEHKLYFFTWLWQHPPFRI